MVVYPIAGSPETLFRTLVIKGYMRTVKPELTIKVGSRIVGIAKNAPVTLTEQGKTYILKLKPEDFLKEKWFPMPTDIRQAQEQVRKAEER